MLNIRIDRMETKDKIVHSKIVMDISDGSAIGITGSLSRAFMYAMIGKTQINGDIVIDEISLKADFYTYIQNFEYISDLYIKRIDNIKIEEYLDLIAMLKNPNININDYQRKKNSLLDFFHFKIYKNDIFTNISIKKQIVLAFIALILSNPKVLLIDNFFVLLSETWQKKILDTIGAYVKEGNICMIASQNVQFLKTSFNIIYYIEEQ